MSGIKLPPNPYSKYGRRSMRREFWHKYHNEYTPGQRAANDWGSGCIMIFILIIIGGLIFLIGGPEALLAWMK